MLVANVRRLRTLLTMFLRRPSLPVRRIAAACLALWVVALFVCTLHCTLGGFSSSAESKATAHSCCQQDSTAKSPGQAPAPSDCHTFRDLASSDSTVPRADFVPHFFAFLAPLSLEWMLAPAQQIVTPLPPEPSLGPPPQFSLHQYSGQAPPSAA